MRFFLVRPLGGLFWGPLGDRVGRKRVLAPTIILMAGSTFAICLLPTHSLAGWLAPALLILLRMIQGFSTGGEYGGAAAFMAEYAPDKKRGFYGSFLEFGTLGGFALGSLVVLLCTLILGEGAMTEWGWRLPFLIAGSMSIIGMYLRNRLEVTPLFRELAASGELEPATSTAAKDLLRHYWRPHAGHGHPRHSAECYQLHPAHLHAYIPACLEGSVGMVANTLLTLMFVGQIAMMLMIPLAGARSDKIGGKPMWFFSLIGLFVPAIPMYMIMASGFWFAMLGFAVLGLVYLPQLATISATCLRVKCVEPESTF